MHYISAVIDKRARRILFTKCLGLGAMENSDPIIPNVVPRTIKKNKPKPTWKKKLICSTQFVMKHLLCLNITLSSIRCTAPHGKVKNIVDNAGDHIETQIIIVVTLQS